MNTFRRQTSDHEDKLHQRQESSKYTGFHTIENLVK